MPEDDSQLFRITHQLSSWWGLIITRPGNGGLFVDPPPGISGSTGRIFQIQVDSPVKLSKEINFIDLGVTDDIIGQVM